MATRRKRNARGQFVKAGGSRKSSGKRRRRSYRRNPGEEMIFMPNPPGRARRYAKRAYAGARGLLAGISAGEAIKFTGQAMMGIAAANLIRKKFGAVGDQRDNWEWRDYLMAGLGSLGASFVAKYLFRASPATSRNILMGGLVLIGYRLLQDEIVPQSDTLRNWIGEENPEGSWNGIGAGGAAGYLPGDLYVGDDGQTFVYGDDGNWRPADDSARLLPAAEGYGETLAPPSGLGELVEPSRLGADPYSDAYGRG